MLTISTKTYIKVEKDWRQLLQDLDSNGYVLVRNILTDELCDQLKMNYHDQEGYRKTVVMERYRFGLGEYKYFDYPLPDIVQDLRRSIYEILAPVANEWMNRLNIRTSFPKQFSEMQLKCEHNGQVKPTPLILKYGPGGFNTLHQDIYGDIFFPMQAVICLSEPEVDFTGGQFVLVQQNPRAQSKAIVSNPGKGDMIIFTTNFKPAKGAKGFYRVNMKHGVSEILSGERYTLGIIFHDAIS